ncbi:MAG: leucine-rich repeat protein [Clostridia bacterium]|nr:leucine-rich repeat protein [Clostridia bacterium]
MSKVFLSYRREGGEVMATTLYRELTHRGFSVFYDIESLKSGPFDSRLLEQIEQCDDFILILPNGGLDRCVNQDDWVRQEIVHAIKTNKNIVPVMLRGFEFPKDLPEEISQIAMYNAVSFDSMNYFDAKMEHLISYLSKPKAVQKNTTTVSIPKRRPSTKRKTGNPLKKIIQLLFSISAKHNSTIDGGVFISYNGSSSYLSIPLGVTKIDRDAFAGYHAAYRITRISIPRTVLRLDSGVCFGACSLKSIDLPDSLSFIGDQTFWGCKSLKKIIIPTEVNYIGRSCFGHCESLKEITLPARVNHIGDSCFFGCTSLKKIILPSGISEIGKEVFNGCTLLSRVSIPSDVKSIGERAFANCSSLTEIIFDGTVSMWESIEKDKNWDINTPKYTVYCTDGEIEKENQ